MLAVASADVRMEFAADESQYFAMVFACKMPVNWHKVIMGEAPT
jgi:hypothetical protein